jgi:C-terminal processing protease CtpA/Prc
MLAGLEPLLGEGRVSGARNRTGVSWSELRAGKAEMVGPDGAPQVIAQTNAWAPLPGLDRVPVAVLIDDATASSAEGVAIALRGRANTRFFGAPTYGVSTSNEGFKLSDGANLVITTGVMIDRNGHDQAHGVTPDEAIDPHLTAEGRDPALASAGHWVAAHRACPARA